MIVASDFHGTYNTFSELEGRVDFIVTGKGFDQYDQVYNTGTPLDIPVYFNPMKGNDIEKGYPLTVVNHKANIINKTGASVFFEDEPEEVSLLKLFCPKCRIVLAEKGVDLLSNI